MYDRFNGSHFIHFFSICGILLSRSEKNFKNLVENNGEKFAVQITKFLKFGGVALLVISVIWLILLFFI